MSLSDSLFTTAYALEQYEEVANSGTYNQSQANYGVIICKDEQTTNGNTEILMCVD
jgi:hypothetical protein